jgi:hypothetical protein
MTLWAAIIAAWLILPVLGLMPRARRGTLNANNLWGIQMRDPATQTQPHRAIFAQEVVEWWIKWAVGAILSAPAAYYLASTEFWFVAPMIVPVFAAIWPRFRFGQRQLELLGHAAELYVAKADAVYEGKEAATMQRRYDGIFAHITVEEIIKAMRRRRWLANILVNLLWLRIKKEPA